MCTKCNFIKSLAPLCIIISLADTAYYIYSHRDVDMTKARRDSLKIGWASNFKSINGDKTIHYINCTLFFKQTV